MYKWYQVLVQDLDENVDENLAWLTQDWRSKNVNAIELNCKVVKKVATPHLYINPPFSGLSPFSSKKFHTPPPQVTQFLEGPAPPLIRSGGSNYEYIANLPRQLGI